MSARKKRSGHLSAAQKFALIKFIEENPRLNQGRYDSAFTYKDGSRLWEKATYILNTIPGSQKHWKAWRKCWQDMKNDVQMKSVSIQRHHMPTFEGAETAEVLTSFENQISEIIVPTAIFRNKNNDTNDANLIFDEKSSSPIQSTPTLIPSRLPVKDYVFLDDAKANCTASITSNSCIC